jgi:hypothetical protein
MKTALSFEFRKRAVDQARAAGLPAYFLDETGQVVIRIQPDGRKERILTQSGQPPQVQPYECRC